MSVVESSILVSERDVASLGWRTASDQGVLRDQRLVVAGCGGAGGGVAESAVRNGINIVLADPDEFDKTNLNRQVGSFEDVVGVNKAVALANHLGKIRPDVDIEVYDEGITFENLDRVLSGASLVLDAIDISRPDLSVELAKRSRLRGLPVFMGIEIGLGSNVTCFDPADDYWTVERYFGLEDGGSIEDIGLDRILTHMPTYTEDGMLEAFMRGELHSTPGVDEGVRRLSSDMMISINRWVFGDRELFPQFIYPYIYVSDPIDGMIVVHANDREAHLRQSMGQIGTRDIWSGFSASGTYTII